jgi:hypothetical protein
VHDNPPSNTSALIEYFSGRTFVTDAITCSVKKVSNVLPICCGEQPFTNNVLGAKAKYLLDGGFGGKWCSLKP